MARKMNAVLVLVGLVITSLVSAASAIAGTATFYDQYLPSACYGNTPQGTMIAAANPTLYSNGACGRMYRVTCTGATNQGPYPCRGGSVTVKIVDRCAGCQAHQLDLSKEAFSKIANPDAGRIRIEYTRV